MTIYISNPQNFLRVYYFFSHIDDRITIYARKVGTFMKTKDDYKLIDDTGTHIDNKQIQSQIFVTICRVFTFILIVLGVAALIKGHF